MTKETKALLILDEYERKKEIIELTYNQHYASKDITAEETLELGAWKAEETGKIERWLIDSLKEELA